jgi:hypothetical protein
VDGWRTTVTVKRRDDWLTQAARDVGAEALVTPEPAAVGYVVNILFPGTENKGLVAQKLRKKMPRTCKLTCVVLSSSGVLASVACANKRSFEAGLIGRRGRLAIKANEHHLDLHISSIQKPSKADLVRVLRSDPTVQHVTRLRIAKAQIPLDDIVEIHPFKAEDPALQLGPLDSKDLEIGHVMLREGYFQIPRPAELSLDSLAEKAGLTKPALLPRMRRLMEAGVRRILGLEEMTKEDLDAAYKVFMRGRPERPHIM